LELRRHRPHHRWTCTGSAPAGAGCMPRPAQRGSTGRRAREPTGALACLPAYAAAGAGGVAGKPRETGRQRRGDSRVAFLLLFSPADLLIDLPVSFFFYFKFSNDDKNPAPGLVGRRAALTGFFPRSCWPLFATSTLSFILHLH